MYQLACVVGARKVKVEGESGARSTREGKKRKLSLFLAPLAHAWFSFFLSRACHAGYVLSAHISRSDFH